MAGDWESMNVEEPYSDDPRGDPTRAVEAELKVCAALRGSIKSVVLCGSRTANQQRRLSGFPLISFIFYLSSAADFAARSAAHQRHIY